MNRTIPALALAAALLVACGGDSPATDDISVAIDAARDRHPVLDDVDDETLRSLAGQVCSTLDAGASFATLSDTIAGSANYDTDEATALGYFVGTVVGSECPEHTP